MIDKWLNKIDQLNPFNFFWWIVGFSILLAAWMQTIQHGWVNPDSVLYFEQAKLFAQNEWSAGFSIFKWPFYGTCIALVHKATSLPIQTSAQLLNMMFFGIATASFLQLIKLSGGNNRTWLMGAILLFSSQYIVGDILEMLMRDEGFWAFYLTALVFFIRYTTHSKLSDALLWQLSMIVATLFRIEAILFLLLLPLSSLLIQQYTISNKLQHILKTYSIILLTGIVISMLIFTQPQLSISSFGRLEEIFTSDLYQQFTQKLFKQADIMSEQVLGEYLEEFAVPGLLLTFLWVMGSKVITATGLIGLSLAILNFKGACRNIRPAVKNVLIAVSVIALISMALIIIKVFVLSSRYVVALAWILLIFASFYFSKLSTKSSKKYRITFILLCIVLSLGFVKNILPKRAGYNYSQEAIAWVKTINKNNAPVFYNETRMRYYANEQFLGTWPNNLQFLANAVDNKSINQYEFLLIDSSKKETEKLKTITNKIPQYKLIKTFNNTNRKKFVLVFKRT